MQATPHLPRHRLLVVADDVDPFGPLRAYLGEHAYEVSSAAADAGLPGRIDADRPDLVLLDMNDGAGRAVEIARFLRERHAVSIIGVGAADDPVERIVALEAGVDDVMATPFDRRELLARVRSVLRRALPAVTAPVAPPATEAPERIAVGDTWLDPEARTLHTAAGAEVPVTAMEFELLLALVRNPNRVLSRDQLLLHARNRTCGPFDRSVDICIGRLRRKIAAEGTAHSAIRTVRQVGYLFDPAYNAVGAPARSAAESTACRPDLRSASARPRTAPASPMH